MSSEGSAGARPTWLNKKVSFPEMQSLRARLRSTGLNSVCEEAMCPNISECFGRGVATFLILGKTCTRGCAFCAIRRGTPSVVDRGEPERVAGTIRELGLKHAVITSVTRDDLPDGGAVAFVDTIRAVRRIAPGIGVEVLLPDFAGDGEALRTVCESRPDVLGHNLETVPRLYRLRRGADYARSLAFLVRARSLAPGTLTKSGLMLGMGETEEEVLSVMRDLREAGCDLLTLGQYLSPGAGRHPVSEYVKPGVFERYREKAEDMGFRGAASGPYVRSSYLADRQFSAVPAGA